MTEPDVKITKKESPFQKKYLGLPLWIYVVTVGILVFLLIYYRRKSAVAATPDPNASTTDNTASSATIPPFINQVYVNPEPPEASSIPKTQVKTPDKLGTHTLVGSYSWSALPAALKHAHVAEVSAAELKRLNPELFKKYGNNKTKIPKGTVVRYA